MRHIHISARWYLALLGIVTMGGLSIVVMEQLHYQTPVWSLTLHYELLGLLAATLSNALVWWSAHPIPTIVVIRWTFVLALTSTTASNSVFVLLLYGNLAQLDFYGPLRAAVCAALTTLLLCNLWNRYQVQQPPQRLFQQPILSKRSLVPVGIVLIAIVLSGIPSTTLGTLPFGQQRPSVTVTVTPLLYYQGKGNWMLPLQVHTDQHVDTETEETMIYAPEHFPTGHAVGMLLFTNDSATPITVQGGLLVGKSGIPVLFHGPVTIPADPPVVYVPAFAIPAGPAGIVPQFDLVQYCCGSSQIHVKNMDFSLDPKTLMDQQAMIEGWTRGDIPQLTDDSLWSLHVFEAQRNQGVAPPGPHCRPIVVTTHPVLASQSLEDMQVYVTCQEQVYFPLERSVPIESLNPSYASLTTRTVYRFGPHNDAFHLLSERQTVWTYRFSSGRLHQIATEIAGKSQAGARGLLLGEIGVASVAFGSPGRLPADSGDIRIIIG